MRPRPHRRCVLDRVARLLERPLEISAPFAALDAIVVLGAPLGPGGALSPLVAERVAAAAALWRAGGGPLVVVSGGVTRGAPRAEADAMAEALRASGVPEVVVERASRTTLDNARLTRPLLAGRGARALWIVTQPFHARRAARVFRGAGFDARAWHIADSVQYRDRRRALRWLIREYAAWARLLARELAAAIRAPRSAAAQPKRSSIDRGAGSSPVDRCPSR